MHKPIRVSFVIPTLNQASFIERCVRSCLSQAIQDSEIIIQDGGSTDGTIEILKSFGNSIRWCSEPDSGQSDAVNRAVKRANGDIVAWINSDDYYPEANVVSCVCETFTNNDKLDIVYGDGLFVNDEGAALRKYKSFQFTDARSIFMSRPSSPCAQPAVFFKRSLFNQVGGLREDLHWTMDFELWLRMFQASQGWKYVPKVFAHLTLHSGAKSVHGVSKQIREIATVKRAYLRDNHGSAFEHAQVVLGSVRLHFYRSLLRVLVR